VRLAEYVKRVKFCASKGEMEARAAAPKTEDKAEVKAEGGGSAAAGAAAAAGKQLAAEEEQDEDDDSEYAPPPSRTNWTRLVPPSVLTGHV